MAMIIPIRLTTSGHLEIKLPSPLFSFIELLIYEKRFGITIRTFFHENIYNSSGIQRNTKMI